LPKNTATRPWPRSRHRNISSIKREAVTDAKSDQTDARRARRSRWAELLCRPQADDNVGDHRVRTKKWTTGLACCCLYKTTLPVVIRTIGLWLAFFGKPAGSLNSDERRQSLRNDWHWSSASCTLGLPFLYGMVFYVKRYVISRPYRGGSIAKFNIVETLP
jgi:hypothetical protein